MTKIDSELLAQIADLHDVPAGAYNIRKNGQLVGRQNSDGIVIESKADKAGINIHIKDGTVNKSVHIPVIVTETGLNDLVYNDFFIGENCDVLIVAGCGVHNAGDEKSGHDGIHTFHVGKNSKVRYVEKHLGTGKTKSQKILNPTTVIHLGENASLTMETTQLGGVTHSIRTTKADLEKGATLEIKESILTERDDFAETDFDVALNGANSKAHVISRSVAKGNSKQVFNSKIDGNNICFGHVECDAIIMDKAQVSSTPALQNTHPDASLTHEAAIGKIAGEQIIKLLTLGLTQPEAEEQIIKGFLK